MSVFEIGPVELFLAFALDMAIGDPRWLPHPVVGIGRLVAYLEGKRGGWFDGRAGGAALAAGVVFASGLCALALVALLTSIPAGWADGWPMLAGKAILIYLVSTTLALRGLLDSVRAVLEAPDLSASREAVGLIVGRDTDSLDREGVRRAALESLAESASDGIVAPLFYLALGGLPLAVAYKAASTLDSMVGYKNEEYREFGWASARTDDILNYIPARVTGLLLALASLVVMGFAPGQARACLRTMWRDGRRHKSPNAGVPEAAMAGALGVRLGGPSVYGGVLDEKPYINGEGSPVEAGDVREGMTLVLVASLAGLVLSMAGLLVRGAF